MLVLVFDTETSGLPKNRYSSILETNNFPYILQLAYILYDTEKNLLIEKFNTLIKIDKNVNIEPKSIEIHKITYEKTQKSGLDINYVLNKFNQVLTKTDIVIGHNLSFDKQIIQVEGLRNNNPINFMRNGSNISNYCTMLNSVNLCKISFKNNLNNYKNNYKYPKLSELIYFLFREENINFHDALIDIIYTLRAYYKLTKNIDLFTIDLTFNNLLNIN